MRSIEEAILRTVLYADVFNFPMKDHEIHHFLIHDKAVGLEQVQMAIAQSTWLNEMLERIDQYIVFIGRSDIIATRKEREQASQHLWPLAVSYGRWLSRLPFVRMVALTGALAMRNAASDDDDLDYIVVTAPRRVWIARAFAIVLVRLARLRGAKVCPNYVLSENALTQERHNIFMAHEVAQMVPIYGHNLYERFRIANPWVATQLPNASDAFYCEKECSPGRFWDQSKGFLEFILRGSIGDWIENWELRRKLRRFAPEIEKPHSSAKLDDTQIKGHFDDHGHPVLKKYYARLQEYGIEQEPIVLLGK